MHLRKTRAKFRLGNRTASVGDGKQTPKFDGYGAELPDRPSSIGRQGAPTGQPPRGAAAEQYTAHEIRDRQPASVGQRRNPRRLFSREPDVEPFAAEPACVGAHGVPFGPGSG